MTIEAELPDGTILEFPDGTDQSVIQNAVRSQLGVTAQPQAEDFPGSSVIEPAATVASSLLAEPLAGFSGIVGGPEAVAGVREAFTFQPRTEAGQEGLETLGSLVKFGVDVANIPISGLAGILELVTGQGIEQAANTIKSIQQQGAGKALGERALEVTGSPLAATIAETLPTAALAATGVRRTGPAAPSITPERATDITRTIAAGEARGVPVLTSDIFKPRSVLGKLSQQFSERIPVVGTGGRRAKQQTARVEALEAIDQATPAIEASDIISGLNASANKTRVAAGKRISDVTANMSQLGTVATGRTFDAIDQAVSKLTAPGKLKNEALVKDLNELKQTLGETGQTFETLRQFRTDTRSIADKVDVQGRSQLRSGDKALLDSVIQGVTKDLDAFVLKNTNERSLARYKQADKSYAEEARKLTKSRLKTVLDKGDVNPELVNNMLFSSSPSQVELLFKNLDSSGRQNARLSLMRRAIDNSTRKGEISPERFVSELGKLNKNFKTFFRGESRAELEGLKRLLETTGRAAEAPVVGPTGQALQAPLATATATAAALGNVQAIATLVSGATIGGAARLYESNGVRNMLIRLGKSPKRSTLEADLKNSIPLLLQQTAQELTSQQSTQQTREN